MTSVESFSDPVLATRLRDALVKRVITVLDNERPPYQYGTVTAINPDQRIAYVDFADGGDPVPVATGAIIPAQVGVVVRVSGRVGDRFISDVMGNAVTADQPSTDVEAPENFVLDGGIGHVTAHWSAVEGVTRYRLLLADDDAFTVNVRQYDLVNTVFTEQDHNPEDVVWGKVAALTNGGVGQYSSADDATVEDWPIPPPTDGAPPAYSPDPIVTSGIGFLLAEWVPVPNLDPVTYEVYGDNISGFTPDPDNYLGEVTDSTFFFIRSDADGAPLDYEAPFFVRVVARDQDGAAAPGAQGFNTPDQVQTGDVGRIDSSLVHDGLLPPSPTNPPVVTSGIGYLYIQWDHVVNADAVTYEVHLSSTPDFLPGANTLIGETPSNRFFARTVGPGAGGGALAYGVTYYVKIRPKDSDGTADPGPQGAGFTVQAATIDLATGSITAASGIIADLAVGSAKIQDAAITNLKVADAAISSAKIQDLAVGTAKIADAAIATAKIGDLQVTDAKISTLNVSKLVAGTISSQEIILSNSTASILRSSNFVAGSTGWRIRGNGDAEFSNVTVRGTVESSTINGGTITGAVFRTATSGSRVVIDQSNQERIKFYDSGGSIVGTIGYKSGGWGAGLYITSDVKVVISTEAGATGSGHLSVYQITMNNFTCENGTVFGGLQVAGSSVVTLGTLSSGMSSRNAGGLTGSPAITVSDFICTGGSFTVNSGGTVGAAGSISCNGTLAGSGYAEASTVPSAQVLSGSGQIRRTTHANSSIRYKENIKPWDVPIDAILKMRPVKYDLKLNKHNKNDPLRKGQYGFIAEEVLAIPGLERLVELDEEGRADRFDYAKLTIYLVPVIQRIVEKIGGLGDDKPKKEKVT